MKRLFLLSLVLISSIGCYNIYYKKTNLDLNNIIRIDNSINTKYYYRIHFYFEGGSEYTGYYYSDIHPDNLEFYLKLNPYTLLKIDNNDTYITTNNIKFLFTSDLQVINE